MWCDAETERAWREEVARRLQELEEGKVLGISAEDVYREVRQKLAQALEERNRIRGVGK